MKKHFVEIWGDVVDAKELIFAIVIIAGLTLGSHLLAPANDRAVGLFFGLGGAVAGFILTCVLFKPKRLIDHESEQ